ncbi:hypothetical protein MKSMC1_52090 [Mycobacterium kansasii]|nr:hypothetical protein MKSMC1_52090 [Mycobacterium kansasii]
MFTRRRGGQLIYHPNRTIDGHGAGHTFPVAFHTFRGYRAQPNLR